MKFVVWMMACCIALSLWPLRQAQAIAPMCVHHNDSAGLANALASAASSGISAQIEVEQGTYTVPSTGWTYLFGQYQDVSLLGGYVQGSNCQQRQITASPNTSATNTILDGQSQNGAAITFGVKNGASLTVPYGRFMIEGFEIRNLQNTSSGGTALSVKFGHNTGFTGGIVFRYNWVHNLVASGSGIQLDTGGAMDFTNNLLNGNISAQTVYLLTAIYNAAPWRIVNNTVAANTGEGLYLQQSGSYVELFNNILYGNSSTDLYLNGATVELHADTYGTSLVSGGGNISNHGYAFAGANPGYDLTFHLAAGSGSINSAAAFAAVLPAQDLDGNPRWVGSNPDRGAFESSTSDQAYWLVTSSADSSHATDSTVNCNPGSSKCTLREAITRANAYGASLIGFHLASSCGPQLIMLNSPLPHIDNTIAVDGFSQPGATENTIALDGKTVVSGGINPNLCVVIRAGTGSGVASAFVAGTSDVGAQLDVRGIMFEGFAGPAVSLSANSYHWIHGNAFGIETNNNPFVFTNQAGVLIGGGASFSTIGGTAPADINMYGRMSDATKAAITVSSSTNGHVGNSVVGNLVGVDGHFSAFPNSGTGILVQNSTYNEIYGNSIVASALDGIDLVGANSNWLHDNGIGIVLQGNVNYGATLSNGGSAIALSSNSAGNAVGAFDKTAYQLGYSNVIENNSGPGIWIKTGAGTGNTVLGNYIGSNGPGSDSGGDLAIDFGPQGEDAGSGNSVLTMLSDNYMIGYSNLLLHFLVTGTSGHTFRVDFYLNNTLHCDGSGYGPAEIPIQTYTVLQPGTGYFTQNYSVMLPVSGITAAPSYVTATATDLNTGTTSQISNCATLKNDRLMQDGFESPNIPFG